MNNVSRLAYLHLYNAGGASLPEYTLCYATVACGYFTALLFKFDRD